jgi:hypothetical protein
LSFVFEPAAPVWVVSRNELQLAREEPGSQGQAGLRLTIRAELLREVLRGREVGRQGVPHTHQVLGKHL